ncbi:MAG: DUF4388 domain-containing protein [Candidatus Methylacidiphilales bacterium]
MRIGLAIWPLEDAEWLELGLMSKLQVQIERIGSGIKEPVAPLHLVIIDGDNPGPDFLGYYRTLTSGFGMPPIMIIGTPSSPVLSAIDWDPSECVFIAKPYEIEFVIKQVIRMLDAFQQKRTKVAESTPPPSADSSKTLGYLSTLALSDLIQMLCMSDWTGMVCIEQLSDGKTGYVYISDGNLYHAEESSSSGLQACYLMLQWGRCKYSFNEEKVLDRVTIQMPWQEVILEGARQMDVSSSLREGDGTLPVHLFQ